MKASGTSCNKLCNFCCLRYFPSEQCVYLHCCRTKQYHEKIQRDPSNTNLFCSTHFSAQLSSFFFSDWLAHTQTANWLLATLVASVSPFPERAQNKLLQQNDNVLNKQAAGGIFKVGSKKEFRSLPTKRVSDSTFLPLAQQQSREDEWHDINEWTTVVH